jgi:hypothetical protein
MSPFRVCLLVFGVVTVLFFDALALICHSPDMPGPYVSSSESFNEKALWLRKAIERRPSADILVMGSSMALHNIDGAELARVTGTGAIVNASSWGMSPEDSQEVIQILSDRLHPRLVILTCFGGDFMMRTRPAINWPAFDRCLSSPFLLPLYLSAPDGRYYWATYKDQQKPANKLRRGGESLNFDAYGGVPLSCEYYKGGGTEDLSPALYKSWSPDALGALDGIRADLQARNIRLLVVASPLSPRAEQIVGARWNTELWPEVARRVTAPGCAFIHVTGPEFTSNEFGDSYHLNACGAEKLIRRLAPKLEELLRPQ